MKKIFSVLLSAVLLFTLAVSAFAANPITHSSDSTGDAIVKTDTTAMGNGTFSVSIPADMTVVWGQTSTSFNYTIDTQLAVGKLLQVTAAPANSTMRFNALTLAYTLTGDTNFTTSTQVVNSMTKAVAVNVAQAAWSAAPVAEYSDTITFTAAIVDA